jgi:hypothetical protein
MARQCTSRRRGCSGCTTLRSSRSCACSGCDEWSYTERSPSQGAVHLWIGQYGSESGRWITFGLQPYRGRSHQNLVSSTRSWPGSGGQAPGLVRATWRHPHSGRRLDNCYPSRDGTHDPDGALRFARMAAPMQAGHRSTPSPTYSPSLARRSQKVQNSHCDLSLPAGARGARACRRRCHNRP